MRSSPGTGDESNDASAANPFEPLFPSPPQFDIAALLRGHANSGITPIEDCKCF